MIAKCIAVLAIVAHINAYATNSGSYTHNHPVALSSGISDGCGGSSNGGVITRNVVAKGKYPVALQNTMPASLKSIPVTTYQVRTPVQEKPTVRLPANIPAQRTIAHSCTCYKTVLRPRVHQQIITVPTIERYIETAHRPVVENIHYEACPVNCEESSNMGPQTMEVVPQMQDVEVLTGHAMQVPQQVRTISVPRVEASVVSQPQTFQIAQIRTLQPSQVQTVEVPCVQTFEIPQVQSC